jgi:fructokinase
MPELITLGECLIDMVPTEEQCFCPHAGGAPANVAVTAAQMGRETAFVGKYGDDLFGGHLHTYLTRMGVDTTAFTPTDEAPTALAFIQYDEGQVPQFSFYRHPGADEMLRFQDIPAGLLEGARAFHFGSISLYSEPAASATKQAAQAVRAAGGLVSYDPNLRPALMATRPGAMGAARTGAGLAHVLKASSEELLELAVAADEASALERLLGAGVTRLIAITRGADGATLATAGQRVDVPGEAVTVVDTTGAGDTFTAALLDRLLALEIGPEALPNLDSTQLSDLAATANRRAAESTTRAGATG